MASSTQHAVLKCHASSGAPLLCGHVGWPLHATVWVPGSHHCRSQTSVMEQQHALQKTQHSWGRSEPFEKQVISIPVPQNQFYELGLNNITGSRWKRKCNTSSTLQRFFCKNSHLITSGRMLFQLPKTITSLEPNLKKSRRSLRQGQSRSHHRGQLSGCGRVRTT